MALAHGDKIALAALVLSVIGVSWQIRDAVVGADTSMLGLSQRVVEFRCHTSATGKRGADICWGSEDGSKPSTGRLTLIAPVFFVNEGASGYNTVVDRVTARLDLPFRPEPVELMAHGFWNLAQDGSGNSNRPYAPILVEGGKSNGAELRFVALLEQDFVNWRRFAEHVADGSMPDLEVVITATLVAEKNPLKQICKLTFSDGARGALAARMDRRSTQRRVTAVCG